MARLKEVLIVRKKKTERTRSIGFESFSATPKGSDTPAESDSEEIAQPRAIVQQVSSREFSELHRDEEVETALETVPLRLIEPRAMGAAPAAGDVWGLAAIGATNTSFTGKGITVAVLDTGIDETHPAFKDVTLIKRNFTREGKGETDVTDSHGHGTHCAGTIFGRDVGGRRIGIARGVERAVIGKVLGKGGGSTGSLYTAINWAIEQGAQVVSMSLGMDFVGLRQQFVDDGMHELAATAEILRLVIENVRFFDDFGHTLRTGATFGRGALVLAASGNESERRDVARPFTLGTAFPAATQDFVSIGAIEQTGDATTPFRVASFSNAGAKLAAPGVDILSAAPGGGLQLMSGTSMATPHVAGLAALWYQKGSSRGRTTPEKVLEAMNQAVRRADDLGLAEEDVGNGVPQAPK